MYRTRRVQQKRFTSPPRAEVLKVLRLTALWAVAAVAAGTAILQLPFGDLRHIEYHGSLQPRTPPRHSAALSPLKGAQDVYVFILLMINEHNVQHT